MSILLLHVITFACSPYLIDSARLYQHSYISLHYTCDLRLILYYDDCIDIDECAILNGGCHQVCDNEVGNFSCSCLEGYELDTDAITCVGTSHLVYI